MRPLKKRENRNQNGNFRWSQKADRERRDKKLHKKTELDLEMNTLRTVTIVQLQSILDIAREPGRLTGEVNTLPDCEADISSRGFEKSKRSRRKTVYCFITTFNFPEWPELSLFNIKSIFK